MRWTWIACGALAVSLAGNVYLLAGNRGHSPPPPRATRANDRPTSWREIPELVEPATKYAVLDRAALEQRVADVEARIEALLNPEEHFERGQPSPEMEKFVRPYLDRAFDVAAGAERPYQIECRGGVCKLTSGLPMQQWMEKLQSDHPDRLLFGLMFSNRAAYIEREDPEIAGGAWLWATIVATAKPAVATCQDTIHASGDLEIRLLLDPSRHVVQSASGSLVDDPFAQCVRRALDDAIAKTPVPPEATAVLGQPLDFKRP